MIIDHERVTMLDVMVPVRMGVRLRPLPAFMFMLVMLIMDMEVFMPKARMDMLDLDRVPRGPQPSRQRRRRDSQDAQHDEGRSHPSTGSDPSGQGIGRQPAGMAEGELRGVYRRAILGMGGSPQQPPGRCQHGGVGGTERDPDRQQQG